MTADCARDDEITRWALAARDGDRAIQGSFVRATQHDVWRLIARLAGVALADDLAQETYLRALRSLPGFAARGSARAWLLSIARRVVIDQLRAQCARPRLAMVSDWQYALERAQPRDLPGFDEGVALWELLGCLAEERREAFVLTQLHGLSYAAAAERRGCPVGTIRSRVARARGELLALLDEAVGEPTCQEGGFRTSSDAVG